MGENEQWKLAIACEGRVVILEESESTQDSAIELKLQPGDVCGALVQTAGRGRRGSMWNASGGVAITVVLKEATAELAIAVAAVLADQIDAYVADAIGIKWPNDLYVKGKKLAGILIEQREGVCLVGVGVNVKKNDVPNAISLSEIGGDLERASVANLIVSSIFTACDLDPETAIALWQSRDILVGTIQTYVADNRNVTGTVLSIDPLHNLVLQTDSGQVTLDANLTCGQVDRGSI